MLAPPPLATSIIAPLLRSMFYKIVIFRNFLKLKVLESLYDKAECGIFQNTFSTDHLWTIASVIWRVTIILSYHFFLCCCIWVTKEIRGTTELLLLAYSHSIKTIEILLHPNQSFEHMLTVPEPSQKKICKI